ncbi:hypothetical protein GWI33_012399 [Rhynchophorus ferrugineus]|uniref:Uncharacterized protein n=1 Tax=Rhynchophorus ferrugineus TaxID=354439 RepID=A0A834IA78_RHYFE|nr:hypothetical protein GWI33_012399 [Rhynchophorus ferrugineus]
MPTHTVNSSHPTPSTHDRSNRTNGPGRSIRHHPRKIVPNAQIALDGRPGPPHARFNELNHGARVKFRNYQCEISFFSAPPAANWEMMRRSAREAVSQGKLTC